MSGVCLSVITAVADVDSNIRWIAIYLVDRTTALYSMLKEPCKACSIQFIQSGEKEQSLVVTVCSQEPLFRGSSYGCHERHIVISPYWDVRPTSDIYSYFTTLEVASHADVLRSF